jgi:hypothetical protein
MSRWISLREQDLLLSVSALTPFPIDATHAPGDEPILAQVVTQLGNNCATLIAWEHSHIPALANATNSIVGATH